MAAARFVYLNVNCFNGLYRENSKGIFNTPHGTTANGSPRGGYPTTAEYELAANVLKTCNIATRDFTDTIGLATEGDFLYCDSPYLDTFSNYTAEGFGEDDHVELAAALREAAANGVAVVASNSDTARVHELYDWAHVESLTEQHMVGSTGARRGARNAVLIASDRKLLQGIG
jgi:DNA adenine methylase